MVAALPPSVQGADILADPYATRTTGAQITPRFTEVS